jgi:hypothetical protein
MRKTMSRLALTWLLSRAPADPRRPGLVFDSGSAARAREERRESGKAQDLARPRILPGQDTTSSAVQRDAAEISKR